jgi:hypothetical protein
METRRLITAGMLGVVLFCVACSFSDEFVVLNASNEPIEVRYRLKKIEGRIDPPGIPETLPSSQLTSNERRWVRVSGNRYQIDSENRTVSVRVMPGEALLIVRLSNYSSADGKEFPLEKIEVRGANGFQDFTDGQVLSAFSTDVERIHSLNYK